jgi:hypothetical protein
LLNGLAKYELRRMFSSKRMRGVKMFVHIMPSSRGRNNVSSGQ